MVASADNRHKMECLGGNGDKSGKAATAAVAAAALAGGEAPEELQERIDQLQAQVEGLRTDIESLTESNDKLKSLDKLKSNFLAVASHELRTPISIIKGYNRMLLDEACGPISEDQRQLLTECKDGCDRMIRMIDSMLDLSKIESGKMEMNLRFGDLGKVVKEMVRQMDTIARREKVRLETDLAPGLPQTLFDPEKIDQVLMNLLENAIKFTPAGGRVSVRVACRSAAAPELAAVAVRLEESSQLEVVVADTGIGIQPRDQERIFMAYLQGSDANRLIKGTGLGLAIAKRIVQAHGGDIWVTSDAGQGSEFHFTVPVERARG